MSKPIRPVVIDGGVARVPLTQGVEAIVDLADIDLVQSRNWYASKGRHTLYAVSNGERRGSAPRAPSVQMHRVVLGLAPDDPREVDHIDHDGLNNRRSNLRPATRSQNSRNMGSPTGARTPYKGVGWHSRDQSWRAYISIDRRQISLGYFATEEEAARAYDAAAVEAWGEFAWLNFPEEMQG